MKKVICMLLALLMMLAVFAGCAKQSETQTTDTPAQTDTQTPAETTDEPAPAEDTADQPASEEPITLTFWTPTWRQAAEEAIIADFEAKYPNIKIEATYLSSADIKTNTKIAASSNTLPDMWYNWGGAFADYYAENGLCLDLTDYANEHNWSDRFLAGALEQATYDGKIIGLPQNLIALVVFYRKDLLEQNGIEIPTTLEELEAACQTLVDNGVTPFATYGNAIMRTQEALVECYGTEEEHDNLLLMRESWDGNEAVTKSWEKVKEWIDKGYFPSSVLTEDSNSSNMLVFSGQCAMTIENPAFCSQIIANGDDINNYGWFPFPTTSGRLSAYAKLCQFNANISDEKLEAAMLFWDYYYSAESVAAHDSIEQPTATIGVELPESFQLVDGLLDLIDEKGTYCVTDLKVPAEVMSTYFAVSDGVVLGTVAPEEADAQIQAAIDSYLANQ